MKTEKTVGEGEKGQPGGSWKVPREEKIMRSHGDPGSHSCVDNVNNEQWVHVEHLSLILTVLSTFTHFYLFPNWP